MESKNIKLKGLRISNGDMTQACAAERVGCSREYFAKVERGNIDGSIEFWRNVQAAFNLSDAETWQVMTDPLREQIRQLQNELLPEPKERK